MRRRDPLADVNLLELAPVRVASWQEVEERVVVVRPRPCGRRARSLFEWLGYFLSVRRLRFDAVGSLAWRQFDGRATVAEVAALLRRELGDEVEPAEDRLGLLVRNLRRERLLAYPGWDDLPPDGPT